MFIDVIHSMQYLWSGQIQEMKPVKKVTNLGNCQGRAPLFFQDIKANAPIAVNIWVKNFGPECYLQNTTTKKMQRRGYFNCPQVQPSTNK